MAKTTTESSPGLTPTALASIGSEVPFNSSMIQQRLWGAVRRGDIALALGLMLILMILIFPLPGWLLDISLALSISFSVLILMTAVFIQKPLELSSFPVILLIATMMRLSLNLASTRLILSHGHEGTDAAGHVIEAFGNFVMGGNFVIGLVVFAILVVVNFVVITKGSGRIAEVSARFILDAMPGKQMAIDSDLSAGLIDEHEARARRKYLEEESTFYGSMDGAAKFVRGDAIAGIVITLINIIGGIIIGVVQYDLSFANASSTYTLLTVGDGLVTQIPALVVSTAAGMLVSKAGVSGPTDKALFGQLSGYPSALGLCSFLMLGMAVLPGIPPLPFLTLSGIAGYMAFKATQTQDQKKIDLNRQTRESSNTTSEQSAGSVVAMVDDLKLEIGIHLLALVKGDNEERFADQIKNLRKQIALELGFVIPSLRILDQANLQPHSYQILIKEIIVGKGELRPGMHLVISPDGEPIGVQGEKTTEPTFGLPALWVADRQREEALLRGYTVVDCPTVIMTHLSEMIKENMPDLLSYAATQKLLKDLPEEHQKLVNDLIPTQFTTGVVQRVLQNLLRERVSIRNLPGILEAMAEMVGAQRGITALSEHVRSRLSRQICDAHLHVDQTLPIVVLSPQWEHEFQQSLMDQGGEKQLAMNPSKVHEFIRETNKALEEQAIKGFTPVIVTSAQIRPFVRSVLERVRNLCTVMSQAEIHPKVKIKTLGQI